MYWVKGQQVRMRTFALRNLEIARSPKLPVLVGYRGR